MGENILSLWISKFIQESFWRHRAWFLLVLSFILSRNVLNPKKSIEKQNLSSKFKLTFRWGVRTWGLRATSSRRTCRGPCWGWSRVRRTLEFRKTSRFDFPRAWTWKTRNRPDKILEKNNKWVIFHVMFGYYVTRKEEWISFSLFSIFKHFQEWYQLSHHFDVTFGIEKQIFRFQVSVDDSLAMKVIWKF